MDVLVSVLVAVASIFPFMICSLLLGPLPLGAWVLAGAVQSRACQSALKRLFAFFWPAFVRTLGAAVTFLGSDDALSRIMKTSRSIMLIALIALITLILLLACKWAFAQLVYGPVRALPSYLKVKCGYDEDTDDDYEPSESDEDDETDDEDVDSDDGEEHVKVE